MISNFTPFLGYVPRTILAGAFQILGNQEVGMCFPLVKANGARRFE
jgi:hypothetical protein